MKSCNLRIPGFLFIREDRFSECTQKPKVSDVSLRLKIKMKVNVKVKPNSSKQEIINFGGFRYLVYVKAAPEDNKANIEMINLLSKHMGVPASHFKIKFGATGTDKILEVS